MRATDRTFARSWLGAVLVIGGYQAAHAQVVVDLSNFDPTLPSTAAQGTSLNVSNASTAIGAGFAGGASNLQSQLAGNQLNIIGLSDGGGLAPVTLGAPDAAGLAPTVMVTMLTAAGAQQSTSLTITNATVAASNGVAQIFGADPVGSYGAAPGGSQAWGTQVGTNQINGLAAIVPQGGVVTLVQMPVDHYSGGVFSGAGDLPAAPATPGAPANLNMSVVNTLVGYSANGPATVVGSNPIAGQTAGNSFNVASLSGASTVVLSQAANFPMTSGPDPEWLRTPGAAGMQTVNRAIAFNAQLANSNIDGAATPVGQSVSVLFLGQSSNNTLNALNLQPGSSTGTTTLSGSQSGNTPWVLANNQMVAAAGQNESMTSILISAGGTGNWNGFAAGLMPGVPSPGSASTAAAQPLSAVATVAFAGQRIGLSLNTLTASGNLQTGPTGFGQSVDGVSLVSSVLNDGASAWSPLLPSESLASTQLYPLNAAVASVNQGSSSVLALQQSYQLSANTLATQGNLSGQMRQTVGVVDYNAATLMPSSQAPSYGAVGYTPYGGPRTTEGPASATNYGPFIATIQGIGVGPTLNGSFAVVGANGSAGIAMVAQTANSTINTLAIGGRLDSTPGGLVTQNIDTLANYVGTPNSQLAIVGGAGVARVTAPTQSLSLVANSIVAQSGVAGSIGQTGPHTVDISTNQMPSNVLAASVATGGSAAVSGVTFNGTPSTVTQTNAFSLNSLASGGALGSTGAPVGITQTSAAMTFVQASVPPAVNIAQAAGWNPDRPGLVTPASATMNDVSQNAVLNVNTVVSGAGVTGNVAQASAGLMTSQGNAQSAVSGFCGACGIFATQPAYFGGGGAAVISNAVQLNTQTLNTTTVAAGINGNLNAVAGGVTSLATTNSLTGLAGLGSVNLSGTQRGSNAVGIVSAAR